MEIGLEVGISVDLCIALRAYCTAFGGARECFACLAVDPSVSKGLLINKYGDMAAVLLTPGILKFSHIVDNSMNPTL